MVGAKIYVALNHKGIFWKMNKKKIINKGYTIEAVSWENDADNYNTLSKTVSTIEEVNALVEMLELCRSSSNRKNGDIRVGNTYDYDGFDILQREVVVEFMEKNFDVLFPNKKLQEPDEDESLNDILIDLFIDKAHELLGGGEYYCRVCESYTVTYYPEDVYAELVTEDNIPVIRKTSKELHDAIANYFYNELGFHYHGKAAHTDIRNYPKGEGMSIMESKKTISGKSNISVSIKLFNPDEDTTECNLRIEFYLWGYQEQTTMFDGWVNSIDELKIILKTIGL